ncbi:MAG: hypothetical protein ABI828_07685 [Actinomycetota bacterium]
MRRPTFIALIVLFAALLVAGVAQIVIANRSQPTYQGPASPGQLPLVSTVTPSSSN